MITVEALRVLILPVDLHQDGDTSQPVQERPASGAVASKPIPILGIFMAFIRHEVDESTVCEWGCSIYAPGPSFPAGVRLAEWFSSSNLHEIDLDFYFFSFLG